MLTHVLGNFTNGEFSTFRVFNSITKTVGHFLSPSSSAVVSWNFLVDSLTKVVRTVLLCLETDIVDEELIISGTWIFIQFEIKMKKNNNILSCR